MVDFSRLSLCIYSIESDISDGLWCYHSAQWMLTSDPRQVCQFEGRGTIRGIHKHQDPLGAVEQKRIWKCTLAIGTVVKIIFLIGLTLRLNQRLIYQVLNRTTRSINEELTTPLALNLLRGLLMLHGISAFISMFLAVHGCRELHISSSGQQISKTVYNVDVTILLDISGNPNSKRSINHP